MKTQSIPVVAQRSQRLRFGPQTTSALAIAPASPMVVQGGVQLLAGIGQKVDTLEHKVDALATVHQQATAVRAPAARATPTPTETPEDTTTALAETPKPKARINRSRLLDFFD
jgi:hypothetical protein